MVEGKGKVPPVGRKQLVLHLEHSVLFIAGTGLWLGGLLHFHFLN